MARRHCASTQAAGAPSVHRPRARKRRRHVGTVRLLGRVLLPVGRAGLGGALGWVGWGA